MIYTAKAIAANAEQIGRLAKDISEQCLDERYVMNEKNGDSNTVTYCALIYSISP